ncbi:MAG: hypothetical protein GY769_05585 [bacterium]|nr:hypothetical protein [bacterium]
MPFNYVLADLLARVPGAVAVAFLDDSGETIEVATTDYSPEELKIFGAYFGISLRQARTLLEPTELGDPDLIHLRQGDVNVHAVCLPDEYYLVLLQSSPASTGVARRYLKSAVADLERELFS